MKRKSFSAVKENPDFLRKTYKKLDPNSDNLNESLISLEKLKQTYENLKTQQSNEAPQSIFSNKMQNFFEFLKNNEKTKHSITKEALETSENSVYLANFSSFSLWDFKKIREAAKKTKRKFQDVGLSPINHQNTKEFSNSLNISSISKDSSHCKEIHGSLPNSFSKRKAEFSFEEQELKKLQGQIEEYKAQLQEKTEKLAKFQQICQEKGAELETVSSKIQDFELISKKNEVLLAYLKEKELKIMGFERQMQDLQRELLASERSRAVLHEQIQELKGSLRIFCRIKPTSDPTNAIISVPELHNCNVLELKNPNNTRTAYYFDQIFAGNCDQKSIFQQILPFIQSAIDGEQVSVLAYGQTGSGKTFTLEGNGIWEGEEGFCEELRGIMPRSVEFIFHEKKRMEVLGRSMKFLLSIIEIYNENLTDLLTPENKPTINQIGGKVIVKNLACVEITDMIQLVQLIKKAARARITDKTQYNERSSRSHCIYRMNISYHNEKDKEGVLNIVDLAGSERSSSQFMEDMANEKDKEKVKKIQNEANFINKSLTTLGRIVRLISEKQVLNNIPYRESKLTRLLQDCLGGNGKGLMFINICANAENYYQTKESLKFSSKAML